MGLPMEACSHNRVVRLEVDGVPHWICNLCNEQFLQKRQVDWRIESLSAEMSRLGAMETIALSLHDHLCVLAALCPGDWEDAYRVCEMFEAVRASNEQAAGMRAEESI